MKFGLYTAILLSLLVGCAPSPEKAFEKDIEEFRQDIGNVGMSVAVVKDNKLVYTHSFGLADIKNNIPLTDSHIFRIASISKSFSATSMMQLIENGMIDLSTEVQTLTSFPISNPAYPETRITLEMLLSHTSSLNDSEGYFSYDPLDPERNENWRNAYNSYRPGEGYEYCNLNYNIVGGLIEKLSGERFDQYIVHHILDPLGLYGGYCVDSLDTSRFAKIYAPDKDGNLEESTEAYEPRSERIASYVPTEDTPVFSPTGGMKISATDLARYMMMHMNYGTTPEDVRIMSEELSRSMQTPRSSDENYGMALWVADDKVPGVTLVGHTGGAYGLRSAMFFDPEKKFGMVMISNGCSADPGDGPESVINGTLTRLYQHFIKE